MLSAMKYLLVMLGLVLAASAAAVSTPACKGMLDHSFPALLTGKPQSLCDYAGKVVLVVNTASQCGYTPQYEGLEALHKRYQARGLVIIGFPSNDFGAQEPGSNKEVAQFCQMNYGVSFPMFEKTVVTGARANPFYTALAQSAGGPPRWNFHKYLIDRSGNRVLGFTSEITPGDARLVGQIERLLAASPPPRAP
jgi:glutathione peroxidase